MVTFLLKIEMGNSAMITNFDLGSKLMGIGNQITYGKREIIEQTEKTPIKDNNGNTVGYYHTTGKSDIIEVQ